MVLLAQVSACSGDGDRSDDRAGGEVAPRASAPAAGAERSGGETSGTTVPTTGPRVAGLPAGDDTTVVSVTDGDTIVVAGSTRVRLIGIDTPETHHPSKPVQCFGAEASAHTRELLPAGTPVRLVHDVERLDRYRRTLAYVYRLGDGLFVNAALVRDGYAQAYTYPPNVAHSDELVALAREAREAGRGLWSACATLGAPTDPRPDPPRASSPASGCDAAYPGVCIPPPPPDLDCAQVRDRRFAVLAPDPHGFDSDHDGVGCET